VRRVLTLVVLFVLGFPCPAAEPAPSMASAAAHAQVQRLQQEQSLPGVAVAVFKDDGVVWSEALGQADLENHVPAKTTTKFRIGSLSKLITAATLARLYERGLVDLDAPIQRYVPSFPAKGEIPITPRLLAGHLAGIRHYDRDEYVVRDRSDSVLASLAPFRDSPLLHPPGSKYAYSSYGYVLLSAALEGAGGLDFLGLVEREVVKPLGLQGTVPDDNRKVIESRTRFYSRSDSGAIQNAVYVDVSARWAAGGFLSTADDLVRFGAAHWQDGWLRAETRTLMLTSQRTRGGGKETGVGLGWRIGQDDAGRRIVHHGGDAIGGRAFLLVYPDAHVAVALLTNLSLAQFAEKEAGAIAAPFLP